MKTFKTDSRVQEGFVTSPHTAASEAGRQVILNGGSAIEAAVAMGAVLSVVYPHFCGIGGDAVWMVSDENGTVDSILGIGQGLEEVTVSGSIPVRGAGSAITSAAAVDSWGRALNFAREHWQSASALDTLLRPAIDLAENGFPLSPSQAHWTKTRANELSGWPGFCATFAAGPDLPANGTPFRQPGLAASLRLIAANGCRDFYEGELASRIVDGLSSAGVPITLNDLAGTRSELAKPLHLDYRNTRLYAPPFPTQGLTTLMAMGILENFPVETLKEGSAEHVHLATEAIKQAFLHRHVIADPKATRVRPEALLDAGFLRQLARNINPSKALAWPYPYRTGDTVFFGAVDRRGRTASVLQSIYFDWGSGVVAGDTGILWHNRGAAFSADPDSINAFAPGKRPFLTLNPGLALTDGKPSLLYGTQGADGQPQTLVMLLTRLIDFALEPREALRRPRFLLGRTFSDSRDSLKIEADIGEPALAALSARGHEISVIEAQSQLAGHAGVIRIETDGAIVGCHDPRSDGAALSCY